MGCPLPPATHHGCPAWSWGGCALLSHKDILYVSQSSCPARTEEQPHKTTRARWVLKDGRAVQQDFRTGGSEGQRCWGVGVAPLTEKTVGPRALSLCPGISISGVRIPWPDSVSGLTCVWVPLCLYLAPQRQLGGGKEGTAWGYSGGWGGGLGLSHLSFLRRKDGPLEA